MRDMRLVGEWALYRNHRNDFVSYLRCLPDGTIEGPSDNERFWMFENGQVYLLDKDRIPTTQLNLWEGGPTRPTLLKGPYLGSIGSGFPITHILARVESTRFFHRERLANVATTPEECAYFNDNAIDYSILFPEERQPVALAPPKALINLGSRPAFFKKFTGSYKADEIRCDVVHDAWVFGGSVVTDRNRVPLFSTTYHARRLNHYNAEFRDEPASYLTEHPGTFRYTAELPEEFIDASVFVLNTLRDVNFAHWLVQELPGLTMLDRLKKRGMAEDLPLLMDPPEWVKFRKQHLDDLGIKNEIVIPGFNHSTRRYRRLYVPTTHRLAHIYAFSHIVGDAFQRMYEAVTPPAPEGLKLFFSRKDVGMKRGFKNEDAVAEALAEQLGFIRVEPGNLSEVEKRELIGKASVIMAVHGGSLHNVMYTPPGCNVIEIFNENHDNWWNYHIAGLMGRGYSAICLPLPADQKKLLVDDIVQDVDVPMLVGAVREVLEAIEAK